MGLSVKVFIYDVTRGMARNMSMLLIGRQVNGVWHTGIAAYGSEYFFGSGGIACCPEGGTILGHPNEIVDLGETEIPLEVFHEYLSELSESRFRGENYHLLDHNCNTFSNEVAMFLTGKTIPEYIVNLPSEILQTPLGQMMRPFIDNMMREINSGVHFNESRIPSTRVADNLQQTSAGNSQIRPDNFQKGASDKDNLDLD